MNKFGYLLANLRGRLGRRLLLAGVSLLVLLLMTGLVGIATTHLVSTQLEAVVGETMPTVVESTRIEQEAVHLRRLAHELAQAESLGAVATRQRLIEQALERTGEAAALLVRFYPVPATQLKVQVALSDAAAEALATAAEQRQISVSALRRVRMQLDWLLADLDSELLYLSDEQALLLEQALQRHTHAEHATRLAAEGRILGQINNGAQEIAGLLLPLAMPADEPRPLSLLAPSHSRLEKLITLSQQLPANSSGSLKRMLDQLQDYVVAEGGLGQAMAGYYKTDERTRNTLQVLDEQLSKQNALAGKLGELARRNAQTHLQESAVYSAWGRWLGMLVTVAAVSVMLWILFGLIGHRVIARLSLLGRNIESLAQRKYTLVHRIGGRDELGQLAQQVEMLAGHLAEMERSNALALIAHTDAALLISDEQGVISSLNQAVRHFFPTLQVGSSLSVLWPAGTMQRLQALPDGAMIDLIQPFGDGGDEQFLRLLARPFRQEHLHQYMVTLFDVSAQMRSSRWLESKVSEKTLALDASNAALRREIHERKKAQDGLVQATKFAVLGQATTGLAHELNQPLSALTNYLYLAGKFAESHSTDELDYALVQSNKVLTRMARLIRSYRNLGRIAPPPRLTLTDFSLVLKDALELLSGRLCQEQVTLVLAERMDVRVLGDLVRLEQITLNLLGNAIEAMAGCVHRRLEIWIEQTSQARVELFVGDSGPGLAGETMDSLFQPFFTTKQDGLGLGLSICRTLADECQAHIRMASAIGGGALFILSMAAIDAD